MFFPTTTRQQAREKKPALQNQTNSFCVVLWWITQRYVQHAIVLSSSQNLKCYIWIRI
jgi:hypothetical protein